MGPHLLGVLTELREREPLFHRPELASCDEEADPDFWEVGASGRAYSRAHVLATVLQRSPDDEDPWRTSSFWCRELAPDTYLLTYVLEQPGRVTRRATVWRRDPERGWQAVYHQGTVVAEQ